MGWDTKVNDNASPSGSVPVKVIGSGVFLFVIRDCESAVGAVFVAAKVFKVVENEKPNTAVSNINNTMLVLLFKIVNL